MKSNISEQDLKERALELLYGLLDEDEAEELRLLIASDATVARIFDEARETVDRFARAARWEEAFEADVDETAAKNVAVESAPFDGGAAWALGTAFVGGDAATADGDAEGTAADKTSVESSGSNRKRAKRRLKLLRKLKLAAKKERSENDVNIGKRGGLGEERRREKTKKTEKSGRPANAARPASASRFRFGAKERVDGASGWATVGRTSSGESGRRSAARRLLARVPKTTLFQNLIIALALLALSTAVGFWAQETALQARFRDDFRIQIAAPRTLARGESQTISATTTAPDGKPRRVPIRFDFSDAETGAPLLAHTESGDASGVARFKIPDVSDFPARTLLAISAGEREKETFETILTVVDAPKGNVDASAAARFAASETVGEIPPLKLDDLESTVLAALPPMAMTADLETERSPWRNLPGTSDASSTSGGMSGGMGAPTLALKSDDAMSAMGASMSGGMTSASTLAPEAANKEALMEEALANETLALEPLFDVAPADESSADGEPPVSFSVSVRSSASDDKKEAPPADAEPAFNFANDAGAFDGLAPAELVARMNDVTTAAAPSAARRSDAEKTREDESARREAASADLEKARANFAELAEREETGEADADADAIGAAEKRGLDVRFYPTGGRLVAGRENVVWFECVDADGRPVVGEFALNDSTGRVATAKTSEGGVGSLRWTPDVDETYSLETAFDGKIAKVVEAGENGKVDENGKVAKAEEAFRESAARAVEDFTPTPLFETFRFSTPTATVERVAFAVPSRVLESGKGVELEIWAENGVPLAATVEKNGVALAQRVWTAQKGRRRVVLPLDADVSGVLNVSLWNCARTPFERIGSAAVYRKPSDAPTLAATLERNDAGERALRIAVERAKGGEVEEPVWLKAFWAPTLDEALAGLELDETLLYASDERRAETLGTLVLPPPSEPILFDNLLELKESALKKLNAFWLGEAGLAGRVVGFGFVGCAALALLTVFCVVFGALKARRGLVLVAFCAILAALCYCERRRIDFSETLSEAIAVSVDESKAARRRDANDGATAANVSNVDAEKTAASTVDDRGVPALFWKELAPKPANAAEWSATLSARLATPDAGFVLAKVFANDGTLFAWKAIPLAEAGDGEEAE